jgi:transposase
LPSIARHTAGAARVRVLSVVSDIVGVSGWEMLAALLPGNVHRWCSRNWPGPGCASRSPCSKRPSSASSPNHAFLLARIQQLIAPFATVVTRRDEIPGIGASSAWTVITEIGMDMSRFPESSV